MAHIQPAASTGDSIDVAIHDFRATTTQGVDADNEDVIVLLRRVRDIMGMDIIFIGEFVEDQQVLHHVDTRLAEDMRLEGLATPLRDTYCRRMIDATLPQAVPDTSQAEAVAHLPATADLDIKAYLSVPVVLSSGELYGTLCCISHDVQPWLTGLHARSLADVAHLVAETVDLGRLLRQQPSQLQG
ncbi:MAG: GAF domain-containing protein [Burkholderiales bacterium]|jgi:GAF domain-containing protein|nr:GAF domain-containing protein [Burkholderiales bacterium]